MPPDAPAPTEEELARLFDTVVGTVVLRVGDLESQRRFYEHALGLRASDAGADLVDLADAEGRVLVRLDATRSAGAAPLNAPRTGLFHTAFRFPDRGALGAATKRAYEARAIFEGASDHGVSEAVYLQDAEGNGIELYRDRPRDAWGREADGDIRMATLPLDLDAIVAELPAAAREATFADAGVPAGTRVGHVHLQVADLAEAERYYHGLLGFDVVVRGYPGALFVSAGGYHHHLGLNTWASAGGPPNAPGTRGLERFVVELPDGDAVAAVRDRLDAAGAPVAPRDGGAVATDPFGNELLLRAARGVTAPARGPATAA